MARSRNIKPGFYQNDELAECSLLARYIFPGLWMIADREGRFEDRPKRIKGQLLPFDDGDVDMLLNELQRKGFILRYEVENGAKYVQIIKFSKHQNPHVNERQSEIPPPSETHKSRQAPEQHSASTVQAPEQHHCNPADSLIPDSLIPDSGFLIPEKVNTVSSEPARKPRRSKPAHQWNGETVCLLPVVGGDSLEVAITQEFVDEVQRAYPAIDVTQTLSEIRCWCLANPSKRKTPAGIHRFVQNWISREQNRG